MITPNAVTSYLSPLRRRRESQIVLAHGGGGQLTDELIAQSILPRLGNETLNDLLDSADFPTEAGRLAMTIDSYVVQPLQFPGGDIGRLAVSGTINDLAVSGAEPLALALSLILTEGLEKRILHEVLDSIQSTAAEANVRVVTGDTKVVGRSHGDGIYITTAGIGRVPNGLRLHPDRIHAGDAILISGNIADHGLAVMLARELPSVQSALTSDVAPLNNLIAAFLTAIPQVRFMRDPTRGGLAAVAADLASRTRRRIVLDESAIPVREETRDAAEMLGLDVLEVANEGKVVAVVRPDDVGRALEVLRAHPLGKAAAVIGRVGAEQDGICEILTEIGGRRILQKPYGEQLPRIC